MNGGYLYLYSLDLKTNKLLPCALYRTFMDFRLQHSISENVNLSLLGSKNQGELDEDDDYEVFLLFHYIN